MKRRPVRRDRRSGVKLDRQGSGCVRPRRADRRGGGGRHPRIADFRRAGCNWRRRIRRSADAAPEGGCRRPDAIRRASKFHRRRARPRPRRRSRRRRRRRQRASRRQMARRLPSSAKVIPLPQPVANRSGTPPGQRRCFGPRMGANSVRPKRALREPLRRPRPGRGPPNRRVTARWRPTSTVTADGRRPCASGRLRGHRTPRPEHDGRRPPRVRSLTRRLPTRSTTVRKAFAGRGEVKAAAKTPKSGAARVVSWVNMRASADNKAATVKVLTGRERRDDRRVQVLVRGVTVSDGKHGFVYKRFPEDERKSAAAQ